MKLCSTNTKILKYCLIKFCSYSFFCSVDRLCPTLCDHMDCSIPGFPLLTIFQNLPKFMSVESVMPSNHLILCSPVLLLPSIFPSIRVLSKGSCVCIRWPNYWSFSFSISPSKKYSGLIHPLFLLMYIFL